MPELVDLPHETLVNLFSHLDVISLCRVGQACRLLRRVANDPQLWRGIMAKLHPQAMFALEADNAFRDWRKAYQNQEEVESCWRRGDYKATRDFLGHTGRVFGLSLLDREHFVSVSDDGDFRVWNMHSTECIIKTSPSPCAQGDSKALFDVQMDPVRSNSLYTTSFGGEIMALSVDLKKRRGLENQSRAELQQALLELDDAFECKGKTTTELADRLVYVGAQPIINRTRLLKAHQGPATTVRVYQNRMVSCSFDGSVKLWDTDAIWNTEKLQPREEIQPLFSLSGHQGAVNVLSIDSETVVSGGNDGFLNIWNIEQASLVSRTSAHTSWIWALDQFEPGRQVYVSGSVDKLFKVWDFRQPDHLVHSLDCFSAPVSGVWLRRDESRIFISCFDGILRIFDQRSLGSSSWDWVGRRRQHVQPALEITTGLDKATRVIADERLVITGGYCSNIKAWDFAHS